MEPGRGTTKAQRETAVEKRVCRGSEKPKRCLVHVTSISCEDDNRGNAVRRKTKKRERRVGCKREKLTDECVSGGIRKGFLYKIKKEETLA